MITTILFDLDGTLLPMDMDIFLKAYFGLLAEKVKPFGYEPEPLISCLWRGTAAMVKNDGTCANEDAFWRVFTDVYGSEKLSDKVLFDEFYRVEFQQARRVCGFSPAARQTVELCRGLGYRIALATNPLFPSAATESRIRWAGLDPSDFALYTTYENSSFCKPNPKYYTDVAARLGCRPTECLMVGNDVGEDMIAEDIGMRVFLLTDCLINRSGTPLSAYPHGGFDTLQGFIAALEH